MTSKISFLKTLFLPRLSFFPTTSTGRQGMGVLVSSSLEVFCSVRERSPVSAVPWGPSLRQTVIPKLLWQGSFVHGLL